MKRLLYAKLFRLAIIAVWISLCDAVLAQDFDSLILRARQQVEAGRFLDCLATAQQAIKDSPQNFKGYYYAGYALYKTEELGEAEKLVQQAKARAPDESKATVEKLAQAIAWRKTALAETKAGDAALEEGLPGKAAQAYQRAWQAGNLDAAFGLKAANLFAERLGEPATAAKILREVVGKFPNSAPGEAAASLLVKLTPDLNKAAKESYDEAQRSTGGDRKKLLEQALEADPNFTPAYFQLAEIAAIGNDSAALYNALKRLSKNGELNVNYLTDNQAYRKVLEDVSFQNFIEEALGTEQSRRLKMIVNSKKEEDRRLQDARERVEKQRESQLQAERDFNQRKQRERQDAFDSFKQTLDGAVRRAIGRWEVVPDKDHKSPKGYLTFQRDSDGRLSCTGEVSVKNGITRYSCKVTSVSSPQIFRREKAITALDLLDESGWFERDWLSSAPIIEAKLQGEFVADYYGKKQGRNAKLNWSGYLSTDGGLLEIQFETTSETAFPDLHYLHLRRMKP